MLVAVVLVLAVVGWVAWTWWGSTVVARQQGRRAADAAVASWAGEPSPSTAGPREGQVLAVMRIPALGQDWRWPVVASTNDAGRALEHGLAWYRGTALPGQVGNFAVSGRSATGANAFAHLVDVPAGAEVIVETPTATYHYVIDVPASRLTVNRGQTWVLDPVPGHPDANPQQALITLTTSQDKVTTADRSVAFGHLTATTKR